MSGVFLTAVFFGVAVVTIWVDTVKRRTFNQRQQDLRNQQLRANVLFGANRVNFRG